MKASGRNDFEFIFVSSDSDEDSFEEYHSEQPWLALPYSLRDEQEELSAMFNVQGIPTLVTVDPSGKIINKATKQNHFKNSLFNSLLLLFFVAS